MSFMPRKTYICNPLKNKNCSGIKEINNVCYCGILRNRPLSDPSSCFLTTKPECRLELSDAENIEYAYRKETIEKWIENYYGKETEANGEKVLFERYAQQQNDERGGNRDNHEKYAGS